MALSLLIVFAASMATATFVENDFGTQTARVTIYNAWWFELVMLLLGLNFISNMFRYKLFRRKKIFVLMFHLGFIVILIGSAITRYVGFEGIMRIREGESSNIIISDKNYLQVSIVEKGDSIKFQKEMYFSPLKKNDFELSKNFDDNYLKISHKEFIADAQMQLLESDDDGDEYLELVLSAGNGRETVYL